MKMRIISAARRLSLGWKPRVVAKNKAKVDKALFKCSKCGSLCYDGKSKDSYANLKAKYPNNNVLFSPPHMDHIIPVVEVTGWTTWDDFFQSLFCGEENFRCLCQPCHSHKTELENHNRKVSKRRKK
jgi:5-methylcytosine-specific restriction endonuclease McrA